MGLLFATCCFGQAPADEKQPAPILNVNANEVSLDLLVHDNRNRPVLDLDASQIKVTDDGSPVTIGSLHLVHDAPVDGRRVTLVFGLLDSAGDKNARSVARKVISAIPNGFSFAVMNIGSRLRLLQTFTTDRTSVENAVDQATVQEKPGDTPNSAGPEKNLMAVAQTGADASGGSVPASDRAVAKVLLASLEESQRIVQDQNSQPSLAGLLALARNERDISGRKVVIYFTQGLQMDSNAVDMVHSVVGAANGSGVTIYAVDLNALDEKSSNSMLAVVAIAGAAGPAMAAAGAPPARGSTDPTPPGMADQAAEQIGRAEGEGLTGGGGPLGSLATGTGGAYIIGGDSLKKPLKRMVEDMTTYYEASFVPTIKDYDGRFRPVKVTSLRKNIVLRYRTGYFALSPDTASTVKPFEAPLLKILSEPDLPNDLPFHAEVLRLGNLQDGDANTLVVETPLDELDVREDTNTKLYSLHLSMVAQIKNKAGVVIDHFSEDLPQHGGIESLGSTRTAVVTMQRHFVAPPGDYVLEAAIFDRNSEKAGAQRINFVVPDTPHGLGLSDMVLVRRTDPFSTSADPLDPLRYGKAKVIANVSGVVARDAKDVSVFFIIHPGADKTPLKLEMEVSKNGKSIGKMPLPVRTDAVAGTAVPYLGTIQAKSLSPGHYEIAAHLSQGDKSTQSTVDFTISEPEIASADVPAGGVSAAANGGDADTVDNHLPRIAAPEASKLMISSPADPVPPPSAEEAASILEQARARALHYSESLPNFSCVEVTTRSIDASGKGDWKNKDEMAQLLKYRDNNESRTMLEANGRRSKVAPDDLKGMTSHGQFGGVLNAVFSPSAKTDFHWKETDMLGTGMAQVFSYTVQQTNSSYGLTGNNNTQLNVAFHGMVYVDANTMGIRRITMVADAIPHNFSIHASSMAVDYDYVVINTHDYLMPIHAAVSIRQGKREGVLNEIEFRDYKRFGSRVKVLGFAKPTAQ